LNAEKGVVVKDNAQNSDPKRITVGGGKPNPLTPAAFDAMFGRGKPAVVRKGVQPISTPSRRPTPRPVRR